MRLDFDVLTINNNMRKEAALPLNPRLAIQVLGPVVADQETDHIRTDGGSDMPPGMKLWVRDAKGQVLHNATQPEINVPVSISDCPRGRRHAPEPLDGLVRQASVDLDDVRGDDHDHKDERGLEDDKLEEVVLWPCIQHDDGGQEAVEGQSDGEPGAVTTVGFVLGTAVDDGEDAIDHGDLVQHLQREEERSMEGDRADSDDDNGSKGEDEALFEG